MSTKVFESTLIATVRKLRAEAANCPDLHRLTVNINATGRIGGDLKITYTIEGAGYGSSVEGNTLDDVFAEFLRRHGWSQTHQPLCLPNVEGGDLHNDF